MKRLALLVIPLLFLCGCNHSAGALSTTMAALAQNEPTSSFFGLADESEIYHYAGGDYRDLYEKLFGLTRDVGDIGRVRAAIIPHHLVGGYIPATLFNYLAEQKPSTVVIFGPNHFQKGNADVITCVGDWQTPFGTVQTENYVAEKLASDGIAKINDPVFDGEHSISGLMPFVAKYLPDTKVLPLIFPYYTDTSTLDGLFNAMVGLVPEDAVIVSSVDFSHYQNTAVADFHDELNRSVVRNFDYGRISQMEIDSPASIYMLFKFAGLWHTERIGYEISESSANITGNQSLEEITTYYAPFFVDGQLLPEKSSSVLFFGDMMLDRNVKKQIDANGTDYIFSKLAGDEKRFFMGSDLVHANLEGPFADWRRSTTKEIAFRFDPALLPMLKKFNFGMFSQANNHSLDMSSAGFNESVGNLTAAGFDVYGSQYRVDEKSLLTKKIGDYDIAFIGLNDTNSPLDTETVRNIIQKGEDAADYTVVNIHWGEEYKELSNARQRKLAHEMIDSGADVIIGHHPHVIQEMEIYRNRPIFYSLGNFVFDQYFSIPTQQGLGAGIFINEKSISAYVFPLGQNKSQVFQMPYEDRTKFLTDWLAKCSLDGHSFEKNRIYIEL